MLDMFPDTTLSRLHTITVKGSLREIYPYYDISNIRKLDYIWGILSNPSVKRHHGGIRDKLFGTDNGLTKAVLFFVDENIDLFVSWHHMGNAHVADFTTVLLHYPFLPLFQQKVAEAVDTRRYGKFTIQYEQYWQSFQQSPEQALRLETAERFTKVEDLLKTGFLVATPTFLQWVEENGHSRVYDSAAVEQ
jgi:hypothetical protein